MTARAARGVALLCALAASVSSCRDIFVCHGSEQCQARGGGAEGGGDAAQAGTLASDGGSGGVLGAGGSEIALEAGQAGEPATDSCEPPLASCDRTSLNGCETDLSTAIDNCGGCNRACDGVCARSSCHVPSAQTEQPIRPLSPFAVTTDYLYFVWGAEAGPYRLSRVSILGGRPELVADNLPNCSGIAAAPDRIFLWDCGNDNLLSVTPAGVVTDEGFQADGVAPQETVVYAAKAGVLMQRKSRSSSWQPTPGFPTGDSGVDLWPVDVSGQLVVLRASGFDDAAHYDVLLVDQPDVPNAQPQTLASDSGRLVQVRAVDGKVYWLTTDSVVSDWFELRRHDLSPSSSVELVARERKVTGFALDSAFVYLPRWLNTGFELELVLVRSIGEKFHLGSRFDIAYPESVGDYLWFFDTSKERLMRVSLEFGTFL